MRNGTFRIEFLNGSTMGYAERGSKGLGNTNKMRVSHPTANTYRYLREAGKLVGTEMTFRSRKQGRFQAEEHRVRVTETWDGGHGTTAVTVETLESKDI